MFVVLFKDHSGESGKVHIPSIRLGPKATGVSRPSTRPRPRPGTADPAASAVAPVGNREAAGVRSAVLLLQLVPHGSEGHGTGLRGV